MFQEFYLHGVHSDICKGWAVYFNYMNPMIKLEVLKHSAEVSAFIVVSFCLAQHLAAGIMQAVYSFIHHNAHFLDMPLIDYNSKRCFTVY